MTRPILSFGHCHVQQLVYPCLIQFPLDVSVAEFIFQMVSFDNYVQYAFTFSKRPIYIRTPETEMSDYNKMCHLYTT